MSDTNLPRPEQHRRRGGAAGAGSGRPPRRRLRWWLGGLLVLTGLTAVVGIVLARLATTPTGGPPVGRPAGTNPSTSDRIALPAEVPLWAATSTATGAPTWDIWVANPDGTGRRNLTRDAAEDTDPAWSPDRRRIVYASMPSPCQGSGCRTDLYTIGRDGRTPRRRLTSSPQDEREPDWSPDGTRIAYTRSDAGSSRIWVMRADGRGQRQLTGGGFAPDWAPDATRILYIGGDYRLHTINADGAGRRRIGNVGPIRSARWSPDGARIALTMRDAIWIVNADGSGLRRIRQSAADPSWTPDGRHLVFTAYGSGATGPQLRRIDTDGRNEVVLGRDQAAGAP